MSEPHLKNSFRKFVFQKYYLYIIRKTKCSEKLKRSVLLRKTKCSFFGFPPHSKKCLRFEVPPKVLCLTLGGTSFLHIVSDIQVKPHVLVTVKQQPCVLYVVLVYVYVAEIQRY